MRHTYSILSIAYRHPRLFQSLYTTKEPVMNKIVSPAERNMLLNVAQYANPKHRVTKEEKRLISRIGDFQSTMSTKDAGSSKKEMRKANGGYHRPGSMQKH